MRVMDLAAMFEMLKLTVYKILKNKEVITAADVAKGVAILIPRRRSNFMEMEKFLFVWINEEQLVGGYYDLIFRAFTPSYFTLNYMNLQLTIS